jgi:hypothetical protein
MRRLRSFAEHSRSARIFCRARLARFQALGFRADFLRYATEAMRLRAESSERPSGNFETAAERVTKTAASGRLLCLRHRTSTQTLFQWRRSLLLRAIP